MNITLSRWTSPYVLLVCAISACAVQPEAAARPSMLPASGAAGAAGRALAASTESSAATGGVPGLLRPSMSGGSAAPAPCMDEDHDGYLPTNAPAASCDDGLARLPGDCDDHESDHHPSALEVCDSSDEDCDGEVDEGVTCGIAYEVVSPPRSSRYSTPALLSGRDGSVYLYQSAEKRLTRLDPVGSDAWMLDLAQTDTHRAFLVDPDRRVLYAAQGAGVHALDLASGEQKLFYTSPSSSVGALGLTAAGAVYVGGERLLAKLRPDGTLDSQLPAAESDVRAIAVAQDGALAVVARFSDYSTGGTQLGPCAVARVREEFKTFAVYIDAAGGCGWVRTVIPPLGGESRDDLTHVGFTQDGVIILAGSPLISTDLPEIRPAAASDSTGSSLRNQDVVIAAIQRDGALRWVKTVTNPKERDRVTALDISASTVVVGLQLQKFTYGAYSDTLGYVLALDLASGQERWLRDLYKPNVSSNDQRFTIPSLARAADGSIYLVGGEHEILHLHPPQ
jgi:outer membrane protein assembly factor BamB